MHAYLLHHGTAAEQGCKRVGTPCVTHPTGAVPSHRVWFAFAENGRSTGAGSTASHSCPQLQAERISMQPVCVFVYCIACVVQPSGQLCQHRLLGTRPGLPATPLCWDAPLLHPLCLGVGCGPAGCPVDQQQKAAVWARSSVGVLQVRVHVRRCDACVMCLPPSWRGGVALAT